jgi:hypothetical protein
MVPWFAFFNSRIALIVTSFLPLKETNKPHQGNPVNHYHELPI